MLANLNREHVHKSLAPDPKPGHAQLPKLKSFVAAALVVVAAAFIVLIAFHSLGPASLERAGVVRFGSYANEFGDHPTVIVRLADGSTQQITSSPTALSGCAIGHR